MSSFKRIWRCAVSNGVPRRSFGIAIVVGTLLNAINQGDAILVGGGLSWVKIVLTYVVPYCVSTYGAVSVQLRAIALVLTALALTAGQARAQPAFPFPDARVEPTHWSYGDLIDRLERAIDANGMRLVARASATVGAADRGITIPGNAVIMVFRNDYARRMLDANLAAGIEAPIRYYVTENPDRTATLSWRPPAVFAPYANAALDALARELDPIFARIAADAIGR